MDVSLRVERRDELAASKRPPVLRDRRKKLLPIEAMNLVRPLHALDEALFAEDVLRLGIPVKVNIDSGGKPNGIPERR
jgi:hypothetical protein